MAEVLEQSRDREKVWNKDATPFQGASSSMSQHTEEKMAIGALENALAAAEEDLDVQAAKTAKAEAVADLAEFDENIPLDDADRDDTQVSKAEQEVQHLVSQVDRRFHLEILLVCLINRASVIFFLSLIVKSNVQFCFHRVFF